MEIANIMGTMVKVIFGGVGLLTLGGLAWVFYVRNNQFKGM